ncbi:MAG: DUF6265 family protein [Cyclobacteriaceae bacterium]
MKIKIQMLVGVMLMGLLAFASSDLEQKKFDIKDLSWLEGRWVGDGFGGTTEEIWSPASADGKMMGVFRHHNAKGELVFYEFLVLDETGVRFKHFSPDLTGWETKDKFVTFEMIDFSKEKFEVEALLYQRKSDDVLQITAQFENQDGPFTEVLTMKKVPLKASNRDKKENEYAWLSGSWTGDGFGGSSEEIWSPPSADGTMFGAYRHHKGDGSLNFYEFMVLDGSSLRLKHFTPDLIGWETKEKFVTFEMENFDKDKIQLKGLVFEQKTEKDLEIRLRLRYSEDRVETEVFSMKRR